MNAPKSQILNDQHYECLQRVLQSCPLGLATCKQAAECGLDVSQYQERLQAQQEIAQKAKATFFPNRA
jgi:hypothetical protein